MSVCGEIISKIKSSSLIKDSLWSVIGSVVGYGLSLISGVLLARSMGTEIYGEFGLIKQTLTQISVISTFGLGVTCTHFVSKHKKSGILNGICSATASISIVFSSILGILLYVFSEKLAIFLGSVNLDVPLKITAFILILNSCFISSQGLLSGMKQFKYIAVLKFIYGFSMLLSCISLYQLYGLNGAVIGILVTYLLVVIVVFGHIAATLHGISASWRKVKKYGSILVRFSTPIAIQECFYATLSWLLIAIVAKFSSFNQLGIYSAALQWLNVIMFIPMAMRFVALSYLSSSTKDENDHKKVLSKIVLITVLSVFLPLTIVVVGADYISSFYGTSFIGLPTVMRVVCLSSVFESIVFVITQEYTSYGHTWIICRSRILGNVCAMVVTLLLICKFNIYGALSAALGLCCSSFVIAALLIIPLSGIGKSHPSCGCKR